MSKRPERQFSLLEYAPDYLVRAPYVPYALWLALRYRSLSLPALANPSIFTGGIVGESKTDLHALLGEVARARFAPFVTIFANDGVDSIRKHLAEARLSFPLVAKPDIGRNGRGVKVVDSEETLLRHLAAFPKEARIVLQTYIPAEHEAGVFYVRLPSHEYGRITSLTLKSFPSVQGDGRSTLRELILADSRAAKIAGIYFRRNEHDLARVLPAGERRRLVSVGNHVRGAIFTDGASDITPELTATFDRIAKDIDGFYFGRFDVRFSDLEAFKRGEGFTIIEVNGASSEPTHVWDRRTSVIDTYRALLGHWHLAFAVGAENRARGARPMSFLQLLKAYREESRLIAQYPDEE